MAVPSLHKLVAKGDLAQVQAYLAGPPAQGQSEVNAYDRHGLTPLMRAVMDTSAGVGIIQPLLAHGADVRQVVRGAWQEGDSVLAFALSTGGSPEKVALLIRHGADVHYRREGGYDAMMDAVHRAGVREDRRLIDLLELLLAEGVDPNGISDCHESALRTLSRLGRFDAVQALLDGGADAAQLAWTPLLHAVALGTIAEVAAEIDRGAPLEDRDWWSRTPWLLAIQTGDLAKTRLLRDRGADLTATGRCGKQPLAYAIENHDAAMLGWLLENGPDIEAVDDFGDAPLAAAAGSGNADAVAALLHAGAAVDARADKYTALNRAESKAVARRLLEAGADPSQLSTEGHRTLLGFAPDPADDELDEISSAQFQSGRHRRFGTSNPEKVSVPFWEAMIRTGASGFQAELLFEKKHEFPREPIWCAQRFGQSITFLPDGRIVCVAGEHEDYYDPDFHIYNDVVVFTPDGGVEIYDYPRDVFPPTDFHTATLVGESIYLIGSWGYTGSRRYGQTPVYRLDTRRLRIEAVATSGTDPGWIYDHRAVLRSAREIVISSGTIMTWDGHREERTENTAEFVFHIEQGIWTMATAG